MASVIAACSGISRYSAILLAAVSFSHGALQFYGGTAVVLVWGHLHTLSPSLLRLSMADLRHVFKGRLLAGLLSSQEIQAAVWRAGKYAREGGGTGRKKSPLSTSNVTHLVCVCMSGYECLLMWICTLLSDGALKAIVHLKQQGPVGQSDPAMGYLFVEVYKILPHVNVLFFWVGFNWLMKYVFFFAVSLREGSFIPHTCLHVNVYASFPWSAFSKDFVNLNHYMFSSGDYSQCLYYSNAT